MKKNIFVILFLFSSVFIYAQDYHIVKDGENLFRIGLRYNIKYDKLARLNNKNTVHVKIGDTIYLSNNALSKPVINKVEFTDTVTKKVDSKNTTFEKTKNKVIIAEKRVQKKVTQELHHIPEMGMVQLIRNYYRILPTRFKWIWWAVLIFIIVNFTLIILIIKKRIKTDIQEKKTRKLELRFRELLTVLIFTDKEEERYQNTFKILKKRIRKKFDRKIVSGLLINAHRDIEGAPAERIIELFDELGFHGWAVERINSKHWQTQIKGIRELSRMYETDEYDEIIKKLNHKNIVVRREAEMGVLRLLEFDGLRYLYELKNPITKWYQLEMLDTVKRFKSTEIKNVSEGLYSKNDSVVAFTVKLIRYLNQVINAEKLIEVLKLKIEDNESQAYIRRQIINTLHKWRNKEVKDYLKQLFANEPDEDVKHEILAYFKHLGSESDMEFLIAAIKDEDYILNVNALKTIRNFKLNTDRIEAIIKTVGEAKREMILYFLTAKTVI